MTHDDLKALLGQLFCLINSDADISAKIAKTSGLEGAMSKEWFHFGSLSFISCILRDSKVLIIYFIEL